jgi:hypothetical protein
VVVPQRVVKPQKSGESKKWWLSHRRVVKLQTVVVPQKVVKPQRSEFAVKGCLSHKGVVKPPKSV